ncbi:MAG: hypothetical protein QM763_16490 [Agriterribacter sp.]
MKRIFFSITCLLLLNIAIAQTKSKTTSQSAKPSKQVTLKYLTDKLNENCIGSYQIEHETWGNATRYLLQYERSNSCQNYSVEEIGSTPFIIVNLKTSSNSYDFETRERKDKTGSVTIKIPILKSNFSIAHIPKKNETKGIVAKSSEAYDCLAFTSSENVIIWHDNDKDETRNATVAIIPMFNSDFIEKFKRAIENLKSYYKVEIDPF